MQSFAQLLEWAESRLCTDAETFHDGKVCSPSTDTTLFAAKPFKFKTATLVLRLYGRRPEEILVWYDYDQS